MKQNSKYPTKKKNKKHATVRLPENLLEAVKNFLKTEKAREMGFLHASDVVTEAVRELLEKLGYYEISNYRHFNVNEHGAIIADYTTTPPRLVQVYFRPNTAWCEYCQATKCPHIEYALNLHIVQKILKEKGWKIPKT